MGRLIEGTSTSSCLTLLGCGIVGLWYCGIVGLWDLGCEGRLGSADAGPYSAGRSAGGKYEELNEEVFSIFF